MPRPLGGEIARDAAHAQCIGPVGGDLHIEGRIVEPERLGRRHADRQVVGEVDDALVILRDHHLAFRTQHAVRFDAADLRLLQIDAGARNVGARRREDAGHAGARVGRAAHDLNHAVAGLDVADPEPVGIGVRARLDDLGDGESGQAVGHVDDVVDLEADAEQAVGDLVDGGPGVEMLLEPGESELHRLNPPARVGTSSARKP